MTSLADLLKAKKQQLAAGNRKKTAKIPDGTSRWRLLPTWRKNGDAQFWHDFGAHYVRKPGDDKPTVYICTDKTFGRPCQVCSTIGAAIKNTTDDAVLQSLNDAKSTGRVLLNAMHLDGPTPNEVQILELPPTTFGMIIDIISEWTEAGENPLDVGPGKGKDFVITRTGTGKATKYTVQVGAKVTNVSADVLSRLNNLDEYVAQENAEAEQRALSSVRAAAGLLTAPTVAGGVASRLAAPAAATTVIEDDYAVATPPKKVTKPVEFEDVPDSVTMATASAPAVAATATAAAASSAPVEEPESTGDPELDRLLRDLG